MSSVERCRSLRRCTGGEGPALRSSPFVLTALLALAACAGPTPSITPTEADASESAAAAGDPAEGAASRAAAEAAAASGATSNSIADQSGAATAPERVVAPSPPPPPEPVAAEPETPPDTVAEQPVVEPEAPPPDETADAAAEAAEEPVTETPEEPVTETAEPAMPPPAEEQPALTAAAPTGGSLTGWSGSGPASDRPYVVIRFTEDVGDYEPALAEAVRRALERRPNLAFDLVAVTPRAGTAEALAEDRAAAQAQAAAVMQSLADLGIGRDRVTMRAWTGQPTDVNEIRLYIR